MNHQLELEAHLRLYQNIAVSANEARDVEDALSRALQEVCTTTGWPVGHAFVAADDERTFVSTEIWYLADAEEFAALRKGSAGVVIPVDSAGPIGRTARTGRPTWIEDVTRDETFPRAPLVEDAALRGAYAFPVLVGDHVGAVLEFFSREPARPDELLLDIMAHVGAQLGRVFDRRRALDVERQALEAERRYLAIASHELRTPLATTSGYLEVLSRGWDEIGDEERRAMVTSAHRECRRLATILANFLTDARLHAGTLQPHLERTQLDGVIEAALHDLPGLAPDLTLEGPREVTVVADPFLLQQVLVNLLSNARRYGAAPYQIRVRTADERVEVDVCDRGPGVEPAFVPHLFERYSRFSDGGEGIGLGLEIVANLMALQGGDVRYRPNVPRGACFVLGLHRVV